MIEYDFPLRNLQIRVFGNFPETVWQAIHSHQATHAKLERFLGS